MRTTSVGTKAAAATPATPCAAIIAVALGLNVVASIAAPNSSAAAWKTRRGPQSAAILAPGITSAAIKSKWVTIAVPTILGDVLKLATIPPTEMRKH
jgi:hypothetical protein